MLYIRADGNTQIGMGHVMRCLSIAEAACELEKKRSPIFITADEECSDMIEERGFRVMVLHTDYRDMMSEIPQLGKLLDKKQDILLVDSYQADSCYFRAVSELVSAACLEDMGKPYPVSLLINYNLYAPKLKEQYQIDKTPLNTLLGAQYMPLRKLFQNDMAYQIRDEITDVMITTGGSDPYFAADAFVSAFLGAERDLCQEGNENQITWHVVSGPFNAFAEQLKETYGREKNVVIHEGLKDLKALMRRCDVVLTASGSTVYEVSALGVPMIVFYFAENQRQGAQELEECTDIVNAGCFCDDREAVVERAVCALKKCVCDKAYRELLHEQERKLIDGKGAGRIAEELLKLQMQLR